MNNMLKQIYRHCFVCKVNCIYRVTRTEHIIETHPNWSASIHRICVGMWFELILWSKYYHICIFTCTSIPIYKTALDILIDWLTDWPTVTQTIVPRDLRRKEFREFDLKPPNVYVVNHNHNLWWWPSLRHINIEMQYDYKRHFETG